VDSTPSVENQTHRRLLTLLDRGKADQDALAKRLNPEERAARGELYDWTPKDQIAHNNFWRQDAVWRLTAALEGGAPPDTADDQAWNDRIFFEQRETPWEKLVAETERIYAESAALIRRLTPDDIAERDRYPWQGGESVESLIIVNWYDHPAEHWTEVYLAREEIDFALELRQAVATTLRDLFPHYPRMYSHMLYKLAAYAARGGRPEQAMDALREALTVNPSFVESMRQDPDLDSLRALPEFQALLAG
jgi:tetratricopeptide (TPR) repeat protein